MDKLYIAPVERRYKNGAASIRNLSADQENAFFTDGVQDEILTELTNRGQELHMRQLARLSFLSLHTVQEEFARLHAAPLV